MSEHCASGLSGWASSRTSAKVLHAQVSEQRVSKSIWNLLHGRCVHKFIHMFIFTCSFLGWTFGPKSTLFVSMFVNKADFGPKVDLKNEHVDEP